ncbi:hypothetical protein CPB84DRAFT_1959857 [Gymnopilus junonius]|uniref:Potassium channel domain-containing protein n=1 Tax=Gymnopilus junonius TaxID=109634 RepID=A0A9P5NWD5_GYMJU|nr:hypothetical protein CPB84DRAFT_1959857 [Gymnopilus junonius]
MLILPDFVLGLFTRNKKPRTSQDLEKNVDVNAVVPLKEVSNIVDFPGNTADSDSTRSYRLLPIFSGIVIPFSVMLSIPSLTGPWYVRTGENNVLLETRPNPPLLNAAMALSMVKLMTMLCVIFLTLHDFINIPAVTIFGVEHRFSDGFTYGQAFWFTVCSTVASTATNITLATDYYQTKDFSRAATLTGHYYYNPIKLPVTGILYTRIHAQDGFIDALYLSVVTIEPLVWFGDLHPNSTGSRIFMCFYAAGGILNLALAVALSRDALLEAAAMDFRARLKAAKARQREKHILSRWRAAIRWRLRAKGCAVWVDDLDQGRQQRIGPRKPHHHGILASLLWRRVSNEVWREWEDPAWRFVYGKGHKRLNLEGTQPSGRRYLENCGEQTNVGTPSTSTGWGGGTSPNPWFAKIRSSDAESPPSLTHMRLGGMVTLLGKFAIAVTHEFQPQLLGQDSPRLEDDGEATIVGHEAPAPRMRTGFGIPFTRTMTMTTTQDEEAPLTESLKVEEKNALRLRLGIAVILFILFWMVGAAIFMQTEKWGFGSAVYFCFIAFSSDFAPSTPAGRSIFVVWALAGVGAMTILVSIVADAYSNQYKTIIKTELLEVSPGALGESRRNRQYLSPVPGGKTTPSSSSPLLSVSSPIRIGRSRAPPVRAASMPELQLPSSMLADSPPLRKRSNEKLEGLPHRVLEYAEVLRCLLAPALSALADAEQSFAEKSECLSHDLAHRDKRDDLLSEIEKSLQNITNAAQDALVQGDNWNS